MAFDSSAAYSIVQTDSGQELYEQGGTYYKRFSPYDAVSPPLRYNQQYDTSIASAALAGIAATERTASANKALMFPVVNVMEAPFYAKGDGVTDDSAAIQAAIDSTVGSVYLPAPSVHYRINTQLLVYNKNSLRIFGDGSRPTTIIYQGSSDASKAVIKIQNSSYCSVENVGLYCGPNTGSKLCGMGVYITSEGSGGPNVTQYNTCRGVRAANALGAGFQVGNYSTNTDVNVDGNTLYDCFAADCAYGVRIHDSNTNMTRVIGGAIASCGTYGIEIGKFARGVEIDGVLMYLNGTSHIHITNENSGPIAIKNIVCELHSESFLKADPVSAGAVSYNLLTMENINCTCNYTDTSIKLIDYRGGGSVKMVNTRWGGGVSTAGGSGALLSFQQVNAPQSGPQWLITELTALYDGATFDVQTSNTNHFKWIETATTVVAVPGTADGTAVGSAVKFKGSISIENQTINNIVLSSGLTLSNAGHLGQSVWKISVSYTAFVAAALTSQLAIATFPAKARLIGAYCRTTTPYAGLAGTIQFSVDSGAGAGRLLSAHDVKTAAITKGTSSGDLGADLSTLVQGAYVGSFTGASQVFVTLTSGTGNLGNGTVTNLSAGVTDVYLIVETLP